jgi:hypothetical protein
VIALTRGNPPAALAALPQVTSPIQATGLKECALRALGRKAEVDIALAQVKKMAATADPAALARIFAAFLLAEFKTDRILIISSLIPVTPRFCAR